ncbi:MAG: HAD hydrolase-like protein, partial [Methanobrevibacter sp.]|nr:HAD hydrolase-like protein [Methanobrevibacter sp.]
MKRLAIFDFDGTIFNSVDDVFICFNKTLELNNFATWDYEEFFDILGGNIDEMVSLILRDRNTPENIDLIKEEYARFYNESLKENSLPFPGVHEVMRELQERGILIAINSNRKNDSIEYFVD